MEYIKGYDTEDTLYTADGREILVLRLRLSDEDAVLNEWATHFREQYRYLDDLDFEREGTGLSREEFLRNYVFPGNKRPGPSTRVGDFCEILVADYIEFVWNYFVPRIRYRNKFNRNTSPQGSDVIGFKMGLSPSPKDEAIIFEVKGASDPKGRQEGYERLQAAVDDSGKDIIRFAETLNATKMKLRDMRKMDQAKMVARFQNITDKPYIIKYGASAVLTEKKFDDKDMAKVTTYGRNDDMELIVIHTKDLKALIDELYRRATLC